MPSGVYKRTKRHKKILSETAKKTYLNGRINPRKGKTFIMMNAHHDWLGENAGYVSKHQFIQRHYGKAHKCENPDCVYPRKNSCYKKLLKPKGYDWANISGKYLRDRIDWIQLCKSCHHRWDLGLIKINV